MNVATIAAARNTPGQCADTVAAQEQAWALALRSNDMLMEHLRQKGFAFSELPGFHVSQSAGDLMHVAPLGISQWLIGGALRELREELLSITLVSVDAGKTVLAASYLWRTMFLLPSSSKYKK